MVIPPEDLLLLRIVLDILGFWLFQMNLQIVLSIFLKHCIRLLLTSDVSKSKEQCVSLQIRQKIGALIFPRGERF